MLIVKFLLAQIKFHYYFGPTCPEISAIFQTSEEFLSYAAFDKKYLPYAQTTGIYECYCSGRISLLTAYKVLSDPSLAICGEYVKMLDGGSLVTLPSGAINGILTNVGAVLIIKVIPKIGFHSYHI